MRDTKNPSKPSATVYHALERKSRSSEGMVVFADPKIAGTSEHPLHANLLNALAHTALPEISKGAKRVATKNAFVLTGESATKIEFFSATTRDATIIHFATHAIMPPNREESGLLLSGTFGRSWSRL